jgi:Flp pilus assembly pilin Flp
VRRSLERYLADTRSATPADYALVAAAVALAIALALGGLGAERRFAARSLLRLRNQP